MQEYDRLIAQVCSPTTCQANKDLRNKLMAARRRPTTEDLRLTCTEMDAQIHAEVLRRRIPIVSLSQRFPGQFAEYSFTFSPAPPRSKEGEVYRIARKAIRLLRQQHMHTTCGLYARLFLVHIICLGFEACLVWGKVQLSAGVLADIPWLAMQVGHVVRSLEHLSPV